VPAWLRSRISSRSLGSGNLGFEGRLGSTSGVWVDDSVEGGGTGVEVGAAETVEVGCIKREGTTELIAGVSGMILRGELRRIYDLVLVICTE